MSTRITTYSRRDWGARFPRLGMAIQARPTEAFVHYSDAPGHNLDTLREQTAAIRAIQEFHMDGREWSDIGYHFLIAQPWGALARARIFHGRDVRYVPAAQADHNTGTLAICILAAPGEPLKRNTRYAIETLVRRFPSVKTLGGHRDVTPTDCPGDRIYADIGRMARAAGVRKYK